MQLCEHVKKIIQNSESHSDTFQYNPHFYDAEKILISVAIPFLDRIQVVVIVVD